MQKLVEKWRKLSDDNYANETMADGMDPEFFKECIISHGAKAKVYEECANELDAALKTVEGQKLYTNTGSPKLPDNFMEGWESVWNLLNDYASGECKKRFSGTDPNAVLGDLYQKLAVIFKRQELYIRQLRA